MLHRLMIEAGDPGDVLAALSDGQKAALETHQRMVKEKQLVGWQPHHRCGAPCCQVAVRTLPVNLFYEQHLAMPLVQMTLQEELDEKSGNTDRKDATPFFRVRVRDCRALEGVLPKTYIVTVFRPTGDTKVRLLALSLDLECPDSFSRTNGRCHAHT